MTKIEKIVTVVLMGLVVVVVTAIFVGIIMLVII